MNSCKTHTKIEAKRLRATTFAYRKVGRAITKWGAIAILEKLPFLKGNKRYFAF